MPTILENLIKLREIIAATPEDGIYLDKIVSVEPTPTCGAIACVVGTAALHPYFNAQGLRWSPVGLLLRDELVDYNDDLLEPLFGKTCTCCSRLTAVGWKTGIRRSTATTTTTS